MDANSVSPLWHNKKKYMYRESEKRGRKIEDFLVEKEIYILNNL